MIAVGRAFHSAQIFAIDERATPFPAAFGVAYSSHSQRRRPGRPPTKPLDETFAIPG